MNQYLSLHEWKIIEENFHPEYNQISESVFSLGNGYMGHRANFEEPYSGNTFQGNYVGGIYYPDKTKVGWWKNGYPEYFAKVLNAPSWIGIQIYVDNQALDLHHCRLSAFTRTLDMKEGVLQRRFTATLPNGKTVAIQTERFCSMDYNEMGAIRYTITAVNFSGSIRAVLPVDGNVVNQDANYDEDFWTPIYERSSPEQAIVITQTKKTNFQVGTASTWKIKSPEPMPEIDITHRSQSKYAENQVSWTAQKNTAYTIYKYGLMVSSENHHTDNFIPHIENSIHQIHQQGYDTLRNRHVKKWAEKWAGCDIVIQGDLAAQQGIRFSIFQLLQTYTGHDPRLNIGPKGFTGEKYGGSTYWDTEAFCLPFYLSSADPSISRNLLMYRYKHLSKAIENATQLGFTQGAALYPMVTTNGEECHNEWEITFEEIHRNGAMVYAIMEYTNYTGDQQYLIDYGIEVLIGISRFWAQRVNYSDPRKQYVILGVTGPNEYENNVNNNWYTNYIARWTLDYTTQVISDMEKNHLKKWEEIQAKTHFHLDEVRHWDTIRKNLFLPEDKNMGIFLQQDGFLDKEIIPTSQLPDAQRPLNQKWSWDRILRSCFIKQADVLQGLFFFEDHFDLDTIRRNYDFYEPLTVHESSLSPSIHCILACLLGYRDKAYEMYLRTARLDLDNYNNDTDDGCHITSMAGTWMSLVKGFGGLRIRDHKLHLTTTIPSSWTSLSFRIRYQQRILKIIISQSSCHILLEKGEPINVVLNDKNITLTSTEKSS